MSPTGPGKAAGPPPSWDPQVHPEESGLGLGDPTAGRWVLRGRSPGRTRVSRAGHRQTLLRSRPGRGSGAVSYAGSEPTDCTARPPGRRGAWRASGVIRASQGCGVGDGGRGLDSEVCGVETCAGPAVRASTIGPAGLDDLQDEPGDPSVRGYDPDRGRGSPQGPPCPFHCRSPSRPPHQA